MTQIKLKPNDKVAVSPYGMHYHLPNCHAVSFLGGQGDFYEIISYKFAKLIKNHHGSSYIYHRTCLDTEELKHANQK